MVRAVATVLVGLWLAVASLAHAAAEPRLDGVVISHAEVEADGLGDPAGVLAVLGLRVGSPLDRQRLREGVHALYAGGEVEYLKVEAMPTAEGLHVLVRLRLRARIDHLEVNGVGPLWRSRISGWLELRVGESVSAARLESGVARVRRELRRRGFAEASVEAGLDYHRPSNSVDIEVAVTLGEPRRLGPIQVLGVDDPERAGAAVPELRSGQRLTRRLLDRVRDEVETRLRELGYFEAQVTKLEQRREGALVSLLVAVDPGPWYRVRVDAPAGLDELVREALPDPAEEEVHPAQTAVLAERVRDTLQRAGRVLAEVEVAIEGDELGPVLVVRARPGPQRRVVEVVFPGADSLSAKTLRRAVSVRRGRTWGWRGRATSDATLDGDRATLERVYRERGYADARVAPAHLEAVGEDGVRVVFPVQEGPRWQLRELVYDGVPVETAAVLEGMEMPLVAAGPWRADRVDELLRRVDTALANSGFPEGRADARVSVLETGAVRVVVEVTSGPKVVLGEVVIAGLKKTRPEVVRGILERAGVASGRPYSRAALLQAQTMLYELGLFRRVELVPVPGQESRSDRGLVVRCEEGEVRSYLLGLGWDTEEQLRATLGWSHLNLFGGAHAVSVETRLSGTQARFQASLREHWLPRLGVPGYLVAYRTEEEYTSYSQQRRGLWFELGDRKARPFRHWYRWEYQIVEPDAPADVLSELEREDQRIRVCSLRPAVEWDLRDDPLNPRRGLFASASLDYAFPFLAAEAEFLKGQAAFTLYRPVSRGMVAVGVRLGAIEPLGPDTGEPANLQVPIGTRFFAGGQATHRAFELDSLGVPGLTLDDDGNPIGGNALALVNLEAVRPIAGALSVSLFVDAGNVWDRPASVRVGDLRWGLGLGLRYDTPAGPLRLEYGRKLDRVTGESPGEVFLSFGTPF